MFKNIKKAKIQILLILIIDALIIGFLFYSNVIMHNSALDNVYMRYALIVLLVSLPIIEMLVLIRRTELDYRTNYIKIINTLGADISEAYTFGEIGILAYSDEKDIIWTSNLFEERGIKLLGANVFDRFPQLEDFFKTNKETIDIELNNRKYSVICLKELSVFIFKDVTDLISIYKAKAEDAPVVCTFMFDDLQSSTSLSANDEYQELEHKIREEIINYSKANNILLLKIKDDAYFGLLNEKQYAELVSNKFSISQYIDDLNATKDLKITISIGFGRGTNDYNKLADLCNDAIEVSQARGGNQIVVKNYSGHLNFFGTNSGEVQSTKKLIKAKQLTSSFYSTVKNINNVILVPHDNADFDAIGACLGLYTICNALNCKTYIGIEEKQIEIKTRQMFKDVCEKENFDDILISQKNAIALLGESCLVITVDCNSNKIVAYPKLVTEAKSIAVVDHHRKNEDAIDHTVFNYIESQASSTCEMVTAMIEQFPLALNVSPNVATAMLSGVLLDTNNFKNKATTETFKAVVALKELGAEMEVASAYMKDEYEEFELKTKIMSTVSSPFFGVMIADSSDEVVDRTILARVASEMLSVKGIQTSFVLGLVGNKKVYISARSDGSTNVQAIMERMSGGGHYTSAATLLEDRTIEQARQELIETLELYFENK